MTIWLIGNGFDLALGYKTRIKDFIDWCIENVERADSKIEIIKSKDKKEKLIHFISYYLAWYEMQGKKLKKNDLNSMHHEWNQLETFLKPMFNYMKKEDKNKELIQCANNMHQRWFKSSFCENVGKRKVPIKKIRWGFLCLLQMLQIYYLTDAYKCKTNTDLMKIFRTKLKSIDFICNFNFTNTMKNIEKTFTGKIVYIHYIIEMLGFIEGILKRKIKKTNPNNNEKAQVHNEFMAFKNENIRKNTTIEKKLANKFSLSTLNYNTQRGKRHFYQNPKKWVQVVMLGNSNIDTNLEEINLLNKYDNDYIAYKNTWKQTRDALFLWLHQNHIKKENKDISKELLFEVFGFSFGESDDVFIKEIMLELINTHVEYAELLKQEPNIRIRFNLYEHNEELEEEIGNIKERLKMKIQERFPKLEVKFEYLFWK